MNDHEREMWILRMRQFYQCSFDLGRWFRRTGEYRLPKKGEFFLSGAIPKAYQAMADHSHRDGAGYSILVEVDPPAKYIQVDGWRYQFAGAWEGEER